MRRKDRPSIPSVPPSPNFLGEPGPMAALGSLPFAHREEWLQAYRGDFSGVGPSAEARRPGRLTRLFRGLWAAFRASARERVRYKSDVVATVFFVGLMLFIFSRLWTTVLAGDGHAAGYTVAHLVTWLLITEVVTMSVVRLPERLSEDIRSGAFVVQLLRPLRWVHWELARATGAAAVQATVVLVLGAPIVVLLVGIPALDWRGLVVGLGLLLPGAILVNTGLQLLVGLSALWVEDATPFAFVMRKLSFVLGGMFLPLDLYPEWLQSVAAWLPFRALLHGPARAIVAFSPAEALHDGLSLLAWGGVTLLLLHAMEAAGRRRVQTNGG